MDLSEKARNDIHELMNKIEDIGFKCSHPIRKNFNYEIQAEKNGIEQKVLIYFGKKGLKTVIQGNTDSKENEELKAIVNGNLSFDFGEEADKSYDEYIGTDETGKGDYFGPLTVAGFYYKKNSESILRNLGVRDSKELTDGRINQIARELKLLFPKKYSIISISPSKYNELYDKIKNINEILNWAHSKAVENLTVHEKPPAVITDRFSKRELNIVNSLSLVNTEFIQIPKAERYLGVAAASILARSEMNNWFDKKKHEGFDFPKGASREVKDTAKEIVEGFGTKSLKLYVKLHFKITKEILGNSNTE